MLSIRPPIYNHSFKRIIALERRSRLQLILIPRQHPDLRNVAIERPARVRSLPLLHQPGKILYGNQPLRICPCRLDCIRSADEIHLVAMRDFFRCEVSCKFLVALLRDLRFDGVDGVVKEVLECGVVGFWGVECVA